MHIQSVERNASYLQGRSLASWREEFEARGFVIFEKVLSSEQVIALRTPLTLLLDNGKTGRNDFEGFSTNRIYALLAKSPVFAELAIHPLVLAFAEAEHGPSCLLSACLAINLQPGETVQPWHFDDAAIRAPRPRAAYGLSAFWALDETTAFNGATQVIPGSHLWGAMLPDGAAEPSSFNREGSASEEDLGARADAVSLAMPAGSLALAKGTLWHRGGANRSQVPRLIITPQYCVGWARQIENMTLAVPPAQAVMLPKRARELLGYSIHPPFMGYVDGVHPSRTLPPRPAPNAGDGRS
jgi:ectoine hydroxylase-related dioxygenase (phytanoyl-CoA dioxygenase family)